MSHLANIKTVMKDLDALVMALERMGYKGKIERHATVQDLDGYQRRQEGVSRKAHVIIRQKNLDFQSYNDIGFEQKSDGTVVSYMDKDGKHDEWMTKLSTNYNIAKSMKTFKAKGLKWTETVDEKNRVKLEVMVEVQY
jgi:hypothetical protein